MSSMNRVYLMGKLTRDPVLRNISPGTDVVDLGMAINEQVNSRDGQKEQRVTFVDVTAWNGTARACSEHLGKGDSIMVEGRLQMDEWKDKNTGEKRSRLRIRSDRIHFISMMSKRGFEGEGAAEPPADPPPREAPRGRPPRAASRNDEPAEVH